MYIKQQTLFDFNWENSVKRVCKIKWNVLLSFLFICKWKYKFCGCDKTHGQYFISGLMIVG